jgi:branched-chain amino acid transport system permease protein
MVSSRAANRLALVLISAALLLVPAMVGDFDAYQIALYLLLGIVTQGVALCWGNVGFLCLGQAVFFGLGAYLSGTLLRAAMQQPVMLALLPLCLLLPAAIAYLLARAVFGRKVDNGPFFSLITLALAMLASLLANRFSGLTGGFNGMVDIPDLPGTDRYATLYYVIAVVSIGSTWIFCRLLRSPLGILWSALEQNEERLQFFGFDTGRLKAIAFAIGAAASGLAGLLYAPQQGIVTPSAIGIGMSTQFVIWAAIGGRRSPVGALAATVIIGLVSASLRDRYPFWEALMALIFIAAVLWFPQGLSGAVAPWLRWPARWVRPSTSLTEQQAPALSSGAPSGRDAVPHLQLQDVHVRRGAVRILDGLTLESRTRGICCVIGPNGAGKTSMFNAMSGRLTADRGEIWFNSHSIARSPAWRVAQLRIGRKFQIPSVFPGLCVRDNLLIALWANRLSPRDYLRSAPLGWHSAFGKRLLSRLPLLQQRPELAAGSLSQGARQMLEFAMVALMEPRLMLLDEPCAGLSPAETQQLMEVVRWSVDHLGASALLIEHDMSALEAIGGHVFVLHQGQLLAQGALAQIKASPEVRKVYLGGRK